MKGKSNFMGTLKSFFGMNLVGLEQLMCIALHIFNFSRTMQCVNHGWQIMPCRVFLRDIVFSLHPRRNSDLSHYENFVFNFPIGSVSSFAYVCNILSRPPGYILTQWGPCCRLRYFVTIFQWMEAHFVEQQKHYILFCLVVFFSSSWIGFRDM